jgi:hypothetical protein
MLASLVSPGVELLHDAFGERWRAGGRACPPRAALADAVRPGL